MRLGALQLLRQFQRGLRFGQRGAALRHHLLELGLLGLQAVLGEHALGHVVALGKDAHHGAVVVDDRLIDEIDVALLDRPAGQRRHRDRQGFANKRRACRKHIVEQFVKPLPGQFRQRHAHRFADDVLELGQAVVRLVLQFVHMLRPAKKTDETGRLFEEAQQVVVFQAVVVQARSRRRGDGEAVEVERINGHGHDRQCLPNVYQ
jgi:hypothetical protein